MSSLSCSAVLRLKCSGLIHVLIPVELIPVERKHGPQMFGFQDAELGGGGVTGLERA